MNELNWIDILNLTVIHIEQVLNAFHGIPARTKP